jgi:hypothetical protein
MTCRRQQPQEQRHLLPWTGNTKMLLAEIEPGSRRRGLQIHHDLSSLACVSVTDNATSRRWF